MPGLGILGGTFDPPHRAHTAMARAALDVLQLDRVLLVPAYVPPHKPRDAGHGPAAFEARADMAEIAVRALDRVEVSRMEAERAGPSYTVDLLRALGEETGEELYFLMGADSLAEFASWRDPETILSLCTLVVFPRPGVEISGLESGGDASVVVFEEPVIDVSSTEIRDRISRGEGVSDLISPDVEAFARERDLYLRR